MKSNFLLALSLFLSVSTIGYCETSSFQKKLNSIKLTGPSDISKKANESPTASVSSPYSEVASDPLVNSIINGYGYMMQGATGGTFNTQEQTKQHLDYTRQSIQYQGDEE